jgi:hypothetical protein
MRVGCFSCKLSTSFGIPILAARGEPILRELLTQQSGSTNERHARDLGGPVSKRSIARIPVASGMTQAERMLQGA